MRQVRKYLRRNKAQITLVTSNKIEQESIYSLSAFCFVTISAYDVEY